MLETISKHSQTLATIAAIFVGVSGLLTGGALLLEHKSTDDSITMTVRLDKVILLSVNSIHYHLALIQGNYSKRDGDGRLAKILNETQLALNRYVEIRRKMQETSNLAYSLLAGAFYLAIIGTFINILINLAYYKKSKEEENTIEDLRTDIIKEIRVLQHDVKEGELVRMKNDIAVIKAKLKLRLN